MKLDRNINPDGRGKYALIRLRDLGPFHMDIVLELYANSDAIDFGYVDEKDEFFIIKLRDKYARAALLAYAAAAARDDPEYANEILEMAGRASDKSPFCKRPD